MELGTRDTFTFVYVKARLLSLNESDRAHTLYTENMSVYREDICISYCVVLASYYIIPCLLD